MRRSILQRLSILTILGGVVVITHSSFAAKSQVTQAEFTLARGSVFEIIAQHSIASPQFSWVLSRDGTFVEAKRDPVFRSRLIEAGSYSLNAEISNTSGTDLLQSIIRITVPSVDRAISQPNVTSDALISTNPPLDSKGRILTSDQPEVIQISSADETVSKFSLDIDAEKDSNNDRDATNDNDAAGTYFASHATPLFVWLTAPRRDHTLTLQATFKDGNLETQRIRLVDRRTAQQEDAVEKKIAEISASDLHDGMYAFSAEFPEELSYPALFQWNFGDGNLSLLDAPLHTYLRNGSYTVHLTVRNLKTGEVSDEVSETLKVSTVPAYPLTPDDDKPEDDEDKGSLLGLLLKVVLVGGIAVLFGVAVVFLISKLRRGSSLQEKLEAAEQKISGKEEFEEGALPPMEVIEEAEVVTEEEKAPPKEVPPKSEPKPEVIPEPQSEPKPEVVPQPQPKPQPAVLGHEEPSGHEREATPEPQVKPEPPKQAVPISERDKKDNGSLPPWLQPSAEKVEPPKAQEPKPQTPPQSATPTQPATPKPKPMEESGPAPDWLQPKSQEPTKPKPPPTPQPPAQTQSTPESQPARPAEPRPAQAGGRSGEPGPEGPVPEWLQTGNNNQKPATQKPPPKESPKSDDEPVAFLRAESVEEDEKKKDGQDKGTQEHPKTSY